jgi:hypothetical protein
MPRGIRGMQKRRTALGFRVFGEWTDLGAAFASKYFMCEATTAPRCPFFGQDSQHLFERSSRGGQSHERAWETNPCRGPPRSCRLQTVRAGMDDERIVEAFGAGIRGIDLR